MKINLDRLRVINILIVCVLLYLPYYLFDGKLFIGGDDSRLFYAFPDLWLKNIAWFSWFRLSTEGQNNPQQFMVPMLILLTQLRQLFPQGTVANLAFSGPLVLGYLYFQKLFCALCGKGNDGDSSIKLAGILGALFFILSPIVWAMTISPFLYSVWLLALLPWLLFYLVRYVQTGRLLYCLLGAVVGVIFSLALYGIPWLMGALLPLCIAVLVIAKFYSQAERRSFVARTGAFSFAIGMTQIFAFLPFLMSILDSSGSFAREAMSSKIRDTFEPTVTATMFHNNLLFPISNLFHRSIVFDFSWSLRSIFERIYDPFLVLDLVFVVIIVTALIFRHSNSRPALPPTNRRAYNIFIVAWLVSLFLFTVNIGSFREIFLGLGNIPGFAMFRNAFDKFAIGYVFIYSLLFAFSAQIILVEFRDRKRLFGSWAVLLSLVAIFYNASPIKNIVNRKLWTTTNIETVITFPNEYLEFIQHLPTAISPSKSVLSLPFAFPGYTIIKEKGSNAVFAGTSPIKMFSGLDDFSGYMSFSPGAAKKFVNAILTQNELEVRSILKEYNIGYILLTHNIPKEVMNSYLFNGFADQKILNQKIASWFIPVFRGGQVLVSSNKNYELIKLKVESALLEASAVEFQKISPVKYRLMITGASNKQTLLFRERFGIGWKLYPDNPNSFVPFCKDPKPYEGIHTHECMSSSDRFDWTDLLYFFKRDLKLVRTLGATSFNNSWLLDTELLKDLGPSYSTNPNGTFDLAITLFFYPQLYFYLGLLISLSCMLVIVYFTVRQERARLICGK